MLIYSEKQNTKQSLAQHQQVTTKRIGKQETDWQNQINFNEKYEEYRQQFEEMLSKYVTIQGGHLGGILMTKHRNQLSKNTSPAYFHPYRGGLFQRQLERDEVGKMARYNNSEPAITEWASLIIFVQEKDGNLQLHIAYRKLNAATVRDSYLISRVD